MYQKQSSTSALQKSYSEKFSKITGKRMQWSSILMKFQVICRPIVSTEKHPIASAFLWVLQNFLEYLFNRAPLRN